MLYGVDIHSQYQQGISLSTLKAEGYRFMVCKASEGTYIPSDKDFSAAAFKAQMLAWVAEARTLGMIPGLYHWIKAGDGAGQAQFFHQQVLDAGGPGGMLIQLDCEDNASYADVQAWAAEWRRLTAGHPFLLYTGAWWWGPRGWDGYAITPYLWHSHYLTADADTISDDPAAFAARIPASWWTPGYGGWPSATLMQFTSRGDAGTLGNDCDLNAYPGTREQLLALTRGDDMTPVEHNWLYNLGQTVHGLATGAGEVDLVKAETGEHYMLSLQPFWDKVGGTELGADAVAAVAKAAAEAAAQGANAGAGEAVAGLTLAVKLEGTAEATG